MSDIYSVTMFANGIKYTVFFFASFAGHFHPWTPTDPVSIEEVGRGLNKYDRTVTHQGWYSDAPKGPRLDRLSKYMLYKAQMKIDIPLSKQPGVYFHRLEKVGGVWKIKEPLTPEALIQQQNYFRYVVNKEGEVEFAYRIHAALMWSVEYKYKENGALDKVIDKAYDTPEKIPD